MTKRTLTRNVISNSLLFMLIILSISTKTIAQDTSLKIHYTFSSLSAKGQVTDNSGNGCDATLYNRATVKKVGRFDVLDLGSSNGYLDLGVKTGNVIQSLTNFSVALNLYVDSTTNLSNAGNFIWTFANSSDIGETANGSMYFSAKDTHYSISKTHWANESGVSQSSAIIKGKWVHIAYTQTDSTGTIYINGQSIKTGKVNNKPSDLGATTNNFIGKSCYKWDSNLRKTLLSDFRLYNRALSATEVTALASHTSSLDSALVNSPLENIANRLDVKKFDAVYSNLTLPADGGSGVEINWKSSNEKIISNKGIVKRPSIGKKNVKVVLTAILTKGGIVVTRNFTANVIPYFSNRLSVERDSSNLILSENLNFLMFDLTLPKKGIEGSVITWSSGNPAIVSNEGIIVTRPAKGKSNSKVTLSATITKGNATTIKNFTVNLQDNPEIEKALIEAKQNRDEFIKVIKHYQVEDKNPTKEAAAIFLIENMDVHETCECKAWDSLLVELDTLFKKEDELGKLKNGLGQLHNKYADGLQNVNYSCDLNTITANLLIQNIDSAFLSWQSPYARHLKFDEFCEYILPYRVGMEQLSDWRAEFKKQYVPNLLARLNSSTDSITAENICDALKSYKYNAFNNSFPEISDYSPRLLSGMKLGSCRQYSLQALFAARYLGVPVVLDYTPQWANRSMGHEWNALITKEGKPLAFGIGDWVRLGAHIEVYSDRIPPKIYRETYSKQASSLAMTHGVEEIPPILASPCIADVTKDYYQTMDISIALNTTPPAKNKFAYLCVFDNYDWVSVAWGGINKSSAIFKDLNRDIACLPAYYFHDNLIPASQPVILRKDGTITQLKPDLKNKQTIELSRKYQSNWVDGSANLMTEGKFQAANKSDFSDAVNIYEITKRPESCYQIVTIGNENKYKFFRYLSPKNSHCDVAEIEVYDSISDTKLKGKIICNGQAQKDLNTSNAFDSEPLTSFRSIEADDIWIGLEFDTPKTISKIAFLPPSDDNSVRAGNEYELFYWDNKWISMGRQVGSSKTYRLTYNDVPTNALFLLRNWTKGHEERIFTYENGKQVWW